MWRPPTDVPDGWTRLGPWGDGAVYSRFNGLKVIVSSDNYDDGKRWVHLSLSRRDRLPKWKEMIMVRDWILGKDAKAIQVIPASTEHVNIHRFCLHMFHCIDGDPLPDFTMGTGSI